ncbi:Lipoprotein OS=Streptomyces alboniger OX=132473 GN=CP975_24840 PE=4 SV=1 [Streptomyces alboniger]
MTRPLRLATAALTASAALLLTSCGNDDKPKDDKIAGAEQGGGGDEKSTPPSDPAPSADRPEIKLPSDVSFAFDWPKTGDKAKDAVLADREQAIKAVDMAIAEKAPAHKALRFYYEGEAAANAQKYVQEYVKADARTTGAYRYYNATVTADGDSAGLTYCEDQSKAYDKYLKKDKVDKGPATKNSYVLYAAQLSKNTTDVWVTTKLTATRGSEKCQP